MKMTAAVMFEQALRRPSAQSCALRIEPVDRVRHGDGESLVEITPVDLCHLDLSALKGPPPRVLPPVIGHEAAGSYANWARTQKRFHRRPRRDAIRFTLPHFLFDLCVSTSPASLSPNRRISRATCNHSPLRGQDELAMIIADPGAKRCTAEVQK